MKYRRLGKTNLMVSYLGFGASPLGDIYGKTDEDEIVRTVHAAIDAGINLFDVAPSYGPRGLAEERLGKALEGKRHQVILNTKVGREDYGTPLKPEYVYDYSPERVRASIDASLKRLKTDYIDVYQIHDFSYLGNNRYIAEVTIPELQKLQEAGKIRFIGINTKSVEDLLELAKMAPVDTMLNFLHYNIIDQSLAEELSPFARQNDIGLINASVLYMGLLTPTVKVTYGWNRKWEGEQARIRQAVLDANSYCEEHGFTISDLALKFAIEYDGVDTTLIGIGRMKSLERSLNTLKMDISQEHINHVRNMLSFIAQSYRVGRQPAYNNPQNNTSQDNTAQNSNS